jgi:aspartyl-tRNA(Asn)/glutamyl-tRNA(Gln) amidotransferase subunit C
MANLSTDDVRHIAKLARLDVSEAEVEQFSRQLTSILEYVDTLKKVDTTGIEPTAQVADLQNALRPDVICAPFADRETLLGTSPLKIIDHQIETPSAHG